MDKSAENSRSSTRPTVQHNRHQGAKQRENVGHELGLVLMSSFCCVQ